MRALCPLLYTIHVVVYKEDANNSAGMKQLIKNPEQEDQSWVTEESKISMTSRIPPPITGLTNVDDWGRTVLTKGLLLAKLRLVLLFKTLGPRAPPPPLTPR